MFILKEYFKIEMVKSPNQPNKLNGYKIVVTDQLKYDVFDHYAENKLMEEAMINAKEKFLTETNLSSPPFLLKTINRHTESNVSYNQISKQSKLDSPRKFYITYLPNQNIFQYFFNKLSIIK